MKDNLLREKIKEQLNGSYAHTPYKEIIKKVKEATYGTNPPKVDYSLWDLLEHIRISHLDILDFMQNSNYQEKNWPEEYWPVKSQTVSIGMWNSTVNQIHELYNKTIELLMDKNIDILAELPHAKGYHYIREFLLIAEHNAYHFGQLMSYVKIL